MKLQLEEISTTASSSFRILVNPDLSDFFFWHFHPEIELVFIEGTNGNRHVGEHMSAFQDRDLVLIGTNIPHLNFDYGVKGPYQKIVLHLRNDFLDTALSVTPELSGIGELFELSRHGISFGSKTMDQVGLKLKEIHMLDDFEKFIEILKIFKILANAGDRQLLHEQPVQNLHGLKDKNRLDRIYQFIGINYNRSIAIQEVAELSNLTNEAFCRYFKNLTRLTFTQFVNHYRIDVAKKLLVQNYTVTETCFECGFESLSYFNRVFKKVTGSSPTTFKKHYLSPLR